jgi:hypothetical protein
MYLSKKINFKSHLPHVNEMQKNILVYDEKN